MWKPHIDSRLAHVTLLRSFLWRPDLRVQKHICPHLHRRIGLHRLTIGKDSKQDTILSIFLLNKSLSK